MHGLHEYQLYVYCKINFKLFALQIYKLCTKEYIAIGKDGYEVFKQCDIVVSSVFRCLSLLYPHYYTYFFTEFDKASPTCLTLPYLGQVQIWVWSVKICEI